MAISKWICDAHQEKGDEIGCITGARERIAELEATLASLGVAISKSDQRNDCGRAIEPETLKVVIFPGTRTCPQCGASYGISDLCCPGCGHCFICSEYHDLAAKSQLDSRPECVVKS